MEKAPDFKLKMNTGTEFHLYSALKGGPVVLNFIMGTWCPLCTAHLIRVRQWQESKGLNKLTVIIISTEPVEKIRAWSAKNPNSFIFCSDSSQAVTKLYGVTFPMMNISRPATVLIDQSGEIRMNHQGLRNQALFNSLETKCADCVR